MNAEPLAAIPQAPAAPLALTLLTRAFWAVSGLVAWAVVGAAAWLDPDARGFGTHQQLGLPPCMFEAMVGVPCPGCGLTTSFAHMAHAHPFQAFGAHLMGPFLFLITLAVALASPWAVRRALPVGVVLAHRATAPVLSVTLAAGLVTLALRLGRHFL